MPSHIILLHDFHEVGHTLLPCIGSLVSLDIQQHCMLPALLSVVRSFETTQLQHCQTAAFADSQIDTDTARGTKTSLTLFGDTKCGLSNRTGPPKLPPNILMGLRQTRGPTSTNDAVSAAAFFLSIPGTT